LKELDEVKEAKNKGWLWLSC